MRFNKIIICVLIFSLSACVTTKGKPFPAKMSKEKAIESQVRIAITFLQDGKAERAIYHLKEAVDLDPKSPRVHEVLGLALEKTGEIEKADKHFKKMVHYGKSYTRGRSNYGSYLMRRGDFKQAYREFTIVVDDIYYPNRAIVYQQLAVCAQKLGKIEEVGPAYQKAVALDANYAPALLELSYFKFNNKDYPSAQYYLDQYRSKVEKSSARALLLGIKLARIFEDKGGEASYTLGLKNLYPKSKEYLEYIKTIRDAK